MHLHIDLPHEAEGLVPDPTWKKRNQKKAWYARNTLNTGLGLRIQAPNNEKIAQQSPVTLGTVALKDPNCTKRSQHMGNSYKKIWKVS